MKERVSGFSERGSWDEIVEHGERITEALEEAGVSGEAFEDWEEWRPKIAERVEEEISRKTSEEASVEDGRGERAGKTVADDLEAAGESLSASYEDVREDDASDARDHIKESAQYVGRAADTAGRQAIRALEDKSIET